MHVYKIIKSTDIISDENTIPDTSCFFVLPGMLSERDVEFLRVLRIAYATNYQVLLLCNYMDYIYITHQIQYM